MKTETDKLLQKHKQLTNTNMAKVASHVQRTQDDWILNTVLIEGYEVPFRYKRKKPHKSLKGQRVSLTYYPSMEFVAGMEFEFMKVVRIEVA